MYTPTAESLTIRNKKQGAVMPPGFIGWKIFVKEDATNDILCIAFILRPDIYFP
jgi:hypothetical protein